MPYERFPPINRTGLPPIVPPSPPRSLLRPSYAESYYSDEQKKTEKLPAIRPSVAEKYIDGANYKKYRAKPVTPPNASYYDYSYLSNKLPPVRPPARGKDPSDRSRRQPVEQRRVRGLNGAVGFKSSTGTRKYY